MVAFWGSVALLLVGALLFVLPPLLRRGAAVEPRADSAALTLSIHRERRAELDAALERGEMSADEHARERAELERRVVEELPADAAATPRAPTTAAAEPASRGLVGALAVVLPVLALGVYLLVGDPKSLQMPDLQAATADPKGAHNVTAEQIQAMVERLAEKLKQNPNDAEGWYMLGRSYATFGRYADAAGAYEKASQLVPDSADLLADWADALAVAGGRSLEGRPTELLDRALKLDPQHPKSLALIGTAAFNRGDYAAAVDYWKRLEATLPPGSEGAQQLGRNIAEAQANLAKAGGGKAGAGASPSTAAGPTSVARADSAARPVDAAKASITGRVTVSDALKSRVPADATLFVFARSVDGPRMPLAIVKATTASWPVTFTLDDSSAMSPQRTLSSQQDVMLGARISTSGNAMPQSGDLTGTLGPVSVGSKELSLVIDSVVP